MGREVHPEIREGWEAHLEVRKAHPGVWEGSVALPEAQEVSVGPPGGLGGVGRPSRRAGRRREVLRQVR